MATLIAVYDSDGCVRRCDAQCHEAKGFDCHCICGGALHGVGSKIAQEDACYISADDIMAECSNLSISGQLRVFREREQLTLFEA